MHQRMTLWLAALSVALVAATGVALFVVSRNAPPPLPEYRTDLTLEELMSLEFERLKELHESGRTSDMNPRVKAIVDDFGTIPNALEFQRRVGRALYEIHRIHAQGFADRNPGRLEYLRQRAAAGLTPSPDSETAQLPSALGPDEWWRRLSELFSAIAPSGLEVLDVRELDAKSRHVSTFLTESAGVHDRVRSVLAKRRITHAQSGADWHDRVPLCFPLGFREVSFGRVLVLLAAGQHKEACELTEALMELIERSDLGTSLMGLLHLIVVSSGIIHHAIVPCAQFGALGPDRLVEFAERGRRLAVLPTDAFIDSAEFYVLSFLGSTWDDPGAGTQGLPEMLYRRYGPKPIETWLTIIEDQWPEDIRNFEEGRALPSHAQGDVDSLEGLTRCASFFTKFLVPLIVTHGFVYIHESFGSRAEWLVLLLRAEEVRRGKSFLEFADEAEQLLLDPWVQVHKHEGYWEIGHNVELWAKLGFDVANVPPVCRIMPLKPGSGAGE